MDTKLASTISKIQQDRGKGNHTRAMKRIADAVKSHPGVIELYNEAIDTCIETGGSLGAIDYLKVALGKFPAEHDALLSLARDRAGTSGDAVVGKFLVELQVKRRDLSGALATSAAFPDRTVRDLVQRTRMKRNTLTSAARGGHSVDDELITNMLSEVVMNARLGRTGDAAAAAGEILDSHADDDAIVAALDTFFDALGEAAATCAPALLARARCAMLSSRHIDGASTLVKAVEIDPALDADALDLLRAAGEEIEETPEPIEDAVIDILLIAGAHDRAAELLRARLDERPAECAAKIVERVGRHLPPGGDVTPLHVVFLDAAVEADLMNRVYDTLHGLSQTSDNRTPLLEWLNIPDRARFLSAPVMTLHAELTIEDGDFEGAAGILRSLSAFSSEAVPGILGTLKRHRSRDAALEGLFAELSATAPSSRPGDAPAEAPATVATPNDTAPLGLEHFESNEFRFSSGDTASSADPDTASIVSGEESPPPIDIGGAGAGELGDFDIYDGTNILGDTSEGSPGTARPVASVGLGGRRPLDTEKAGIIWDEEGDDDTPPPPAPAQEVRIGEDHVRNVAGALYASGARTFFYIEDDEGTSPAAVPEPGVNAAPEVNPEPGVDAAPDETSKPAPSAIEMGAPEEPETTDTSDEPDAAETIDAPETTDAPASTDTEEDEEEEEEQPPPPSIAELSFDERFALFMDGSLDDADVVDLAEEAVARHDAHALEQLIENAPRNDGYDVRVGLCDVEWHLMNARPVDGLETLKRLRAANPTEEQRKTIWLRTAECQRMQRNYDAAHKTLIETAKLYPDCPDVERLAKINYRDYLENHCTDAPVLEKVTSLDGDS